MKRIDQVRTSAEAEPSVAAMMAAFSLDAVQHAASQGVVLDFEERSLIDVERLLGDLQRERSRWLPRLLGQSPSKSEIEAVCKMYGGYIGEVIRFEVGGEWTIPEDGPMAGAPVIQRGDSMTSPPSKVYKRLMDGIGDDIIYYYNVLFDKNLQA